MYLFHELPPHIRRKTVAEMARVLKPGGVAIITDSIQLGDRERLDSNLGRFGDFNEPFYRTYITEDFGARLSMSALLSCVTAATVVAVHRYTDALLVVHTVAVLVLAIVSLRIIQAAFGLRKVPVWVWGIMHPRQA